MPKRSPTSKAPTDEAKLLIVLEGLDEGLTAEEVAKRHGISLSQYHRWRDELAKRGATSAKSRIRKQQLMEVAARIFATRGYHATSIDDIAKAMGLTKGSLYYYIDSKEEMLVEIHQRAMAVAINRLTRILEEPGDPLMKLRRAIMAHVNVLLEELPVMQVLLQERFAIPAKGRKQFIESEDLYVHGFRSIIEEGIQAGQIRNTDPTMTTFLVLGMLNWTTRWFKPKGRLSRVDLGTMAADIIISGLEADAHH